MTCTPLYLYIFIMDFDPEFEENYLGGTGPAKPAGEPFSYDSSFRGPIHGRSCTDILCLLLFFIFLLGAAAVGFFAYNYGDVQSLVYPMDSDGNLCGVKSSSGIDMTAKKYLFLFDMTRCLIGFNAIEFAGDQCRSKTVNICVKQCPSMSWSWATHMANYTDEILLEGPDIFINNAILGRIREGRKRWMYCKYGVDFDDNKWVRTSMRDLMKDGVCAPYYFDSQNVVDRCFPALNKVAEDVFVGMKDAGNKTISKEALGKAEAVLGDALEIFDKMLGDLQASWMYIAALLCIACLFGLFWLFLMRWIAGIICYISMVAFIVVFGAGTYFSLMEYMKRKDQIDIALNFGDIPYTNPATYLDRKDVWLVFTIICAVILVVFLLLIIFLCTRIRIAIELIKETARATSSMWSIILWPIFPFILQLITLGYFVLVAINLASFGRAADYRNATNSAGQLGDNLIAGAVNCNGMGTTILGQQLSVNMSEDKTASDICNVLVTGVVAEPWDTVLQFFNIFMYFWCMNFVSALGIMVVAGSFASYYWTLDKADLETFPVAGSCWRSLRYHTGSMAFGALIIALVQLMRVILEYIDRKTKKSQNVVAKFVMCCLKCCFWCLEKIVKFIAENAYIMIAVHGKHFCASAKDAFFLLLRNAVRAVVLNRITWFLLLISKLVISGGTATLAYFLFSNVLAEKISSVAVNMGGDVGNQVDQSMQQYGKVELSLGPFLPVGLVAFGSYVIASVIFSVYDTGTDTMFLCFLEDLERNDGSPEKPYFMSKNLLSILGKKNKIPNED